MCHQQSNMSESGKDFNEKETDYTSKDTYKEEPNSSKGGCGCGCGVKAKPMNEEVIDVEEDFEY